MLRYNLMCPKGHGHWSPTPESFVGKTCGTVKCRELLAKHKDPRGEPYDWRVGRQTKTKAKGGK